MNSIAVTDTTHVAEARRQCIAAARAADFDEADSGRVAIVATELATNVVKHGHGGEILVGAFEDATGAGIEIVALDKGPGMADLGECFRDGYSTAGTPGTGLGAVVRQSQSHDVFSRPGQGTVVLARLLPGKSLRAKTNGPSRWGCVCLPKPGETALGDGWAAAPLDGVGSVLMLADGLGHGPSAAAASAQAARLFTKRASDPPGEIVRAIHEGLRSTRGAAVAVARVDEAKRTVTFAGIGNIAGVLLGGSVPRRMVSHNGTAGHSVQKIKEFDYPFPNGAGALIVLHSDGIGTAWALDKYPGLAAAHPTLTAAVLYRDFSRGRDDASVLVAKAGSTT